MSTSKSALSSSDEVDHVAFIVGSCGIGNSAPWLTGAMDEGILG